MVNKDKINDVVHTCYLRNFVFYLFTGGLYWYLNWVRMGNKIQVVR